MAGSHKSGITAADENLFENAYYIFTPTKSQRVEELQVLFEGRGPEVCGTCSART